MATNNSVNQSISEQFDPFRKQLKQQASRQKSSEEKQVKRQFARTGQTGSGAFVKTLRDAGRREGEAIQQGEFQIGAQEAIERRRLNEIEAGREFAAAESQKGREFASGEAKSQREFTSGEGKTQRGFASSENLLQRAFAKAEAGDQRAFQQGLEDVKLAFQEDRAVAEDKSRAEQLAIQQQTIDFEKSVAEFNKQIALAELGKDTSLMGSMFPQQKEGQGFIGSILSSIPGGSSIGQPLSKIENIITNPGASFSKLSKWCFTGDTLVVMANETLKPIKDIVLGDKLKSGGNVYMTGTGYTEELKLYNHDKVTGSHAVLENEWKRVRDCEHVDIEGIHIVHFLSCDNHIMETKKNIFRDYDEMDNTNAFTEDELLEEMNKELINGNAN